MDECKQLLRDSIDCYSKLLEHAHNFNETFDTGKFGDPEKIRAYTNTLQALQREAEEVDTKLMEQLKLKSDMFVSDFLLEQRTSLVNELIQFNEIMIPRLSSIMAITKDEISKVKKGIGKITAYHSGPTRNSGAVIRSRT